MSFGIRVVNTEGSTQIDSEYIAFRVIQKGEAAQGQKHPIPNSANQVLLVRPRNTAWAVGPGWVDGEVYASSVDGIEYVLLQLSNTVDPSSDSFGARIYKGDGQLIYDTGSQPMLTQAIGIHDTTNVFSPPTKVFLPPPLAGRKRYVDWSFMRRNYGIVYNQGSGIPGGLFLVGTAAFFHDGIEIAISRASGAPPIDAPPSRVIIRTLIADV